MSGFRVGDPVQWACQVVAKGSVSYRVYSGRIIRFSDGLAVILRRGRVREYYVPLSMLQPAKGQEEANA